MICSLASRSISICPLQLSLLASYGLAFDRSLPSQVRLQGCVQVYDSQCAKILEPTFEEERTHQDDYGGFFAPPNLLQGLRDTFRVHNSERTAKHVLSHPRKMGPVI